MPTRLPEPVSPELILVAPPEEAQRAREALPERPASEWDDFMRRMRTRPLPTAKELEAVAEPAPTPKKRRFSRRAMVAIAVLVVAAIIGAAWARDRAQQRSGAPRVAASPVTPKTNSAKPKPQTQRHAKPSAPAKPKPKSKPGQHPAAKKPRPAAFVPARIWSWAAASGAKHYVVRFYRNGTKVLDVRTKEPRLVVPKSFTFRAGKYRWTVFPVTAAGLAPRPIVDSAFVVGKR